MAGLFFCLASDTMQGFCFALLQYSPIQAFTAAFITSMQLYRPRSKTAHRALQWLFLRLHPFNRLQYQTDTTSHCAACDTLEGIHAPGRTPPIPDTTATPERCTGQHRPHIIIRYIRGCRPCQRRRGQLLPYMDRLQVLAHCQQYRPGAPAEGSASPPVQGQPGGWRSGTGSAVNQGGAVSWHLPPGGTVQRQGQGGRRGTIGGSRRISFRAVAR